MAVNAVTSSLGNKVDLATKHNPSTEFGAVNKKECFRKNYRKPSSEKKEGGNFKAENYRSAVEEGFPFW